MAVERTQPEYTIYRIEIKEQLGIIFFLYLGHLSKINNGGCVCFAKIYQFYIQFFFFFGADMHFSSVK